MADWIQKATKEMDKKGTIGSFTKQAKRAKMSTEAFADEVLNNPSKFKEKTRKRAQFYKNMKKKYAKGGSMASGGGTYIPLYRLSVVDDSGREQYDYINIPYIASAKNIAERKYNEYKADGIEVALEKRVGEIDNYEYETIKSFDPDDEYKDGGEVYETANESYLMDDSYAKGGSMASGGEIDPFISSQTEDELRSQLMDTMDEDDVNSMSREEVYETANESYLMDDSYAKGGSMASGGHVSKGEHVWTKLSSSDRAKFLHENFTPNITPRSQELLVGKTYNFLPKKVKIVVESKYANVENYAKGGEVVSLEPVDGRKSFYGKAKAIRRGDITQLQSYDTIVAEYDHNSREMNIDDWYSATTQRHINSFLNKFGYPTMSKSEIMEMRGKKFAKGGSVKTKYFTGHLSFLNW